MPKDGKLHFDVFNLFKLFLLNFKESENWALGPEDANKIETLVFSERSEF